MKRTEMVKNLKYVFETCVDLGYGLDKTFGIVLKAAEEAGMSPPNQTVVIIRDENGEPIKHGPCLPGWDDERNS
jgi:hypothetical protein